MADRSSTDTTRTASKEHAPGGDEHVVGGPAAPGGTAGMDPADFLDIPGQQGTLGDQSEGEALPTQEEPEAAEASPLGDDPAAQLGVTGPADMRGEPLTEFGDGPATLDDQLGIEQQINQQWGYGGADGRNPASDGGGPTQPGAEPYAGARDDLDADLAFGEGAAGKLPAHQQAVLDTYKQKIYDAAAAGDHEGADKIFKQANEYLVEIGAKQAPPASGAGGGTGGVENVTAVGSATPVGTNADGEVVATEGQKALAEDWKGGNMEGVANLVSGNETTTERGKALTQAMDEIAQGDGAPPPAGKGAAQDGSQSNSGFDRPAGSESGGGSQDHSVGGGGGGSQPSAGDKTPEQGGEGPDMWEDFTDAFHDQQTGGIRGGDIDPDPNADTSAVMDGTPDTDYTDYVADYGPEAPADEGVARPIDSVPDEEFYDV